MKAYRGNRSITPLVLNLGTRRRRVVNSTQQLLDPGEITPVPTEQEDFSYRI